MDAEAKITTSEEGADIAVLNFEIRNFEPLEYQVHEAFNTLCTNLSFAGDDCKSIMLTSCFPSEGKSFVAMNMMRTFAQLGLRVVLVDCDLRASQLQSRYKIQTESDQADFRYPGLTRYLAGRCTLEELLGKTNIANAWMILAGRSVNNSLPLLNTSRLKKLLETLSQRFDIVLVDAPPIGTIIDAAKIAPACDGTLFIMESGLVSRSKFFSALRQIERTGCRFLGTVLNQYDDRLSSNKYYYSGSYYYKYNTDVSPRKSPQKKKRQI